MWDENNNYDIFKKKFNLKWIFYIKLWILFKVWILLFKYLNIIIYKDKIISISRNFCNETLIWIAFNYNFKISICKIST